jgi:hypothetical protein
MDVFITALNCIWTIIVHEEVNFTDKFIPLNFTKITPQFKKWENLEDFDRK